MYFYSFFLSFLWFIYLFVSYFSSITTCFSSSIYLLDSHIYTMLPISEDFTQFIPFAGTDPELARAWLPFSFVFDCRYPTYIAHFHSIFCPQLGAKAVEDLAIRSFKSFLLQNMNMTQGRSGVWDPFLRDFSFQSDLKRFISSFYASFL